MSKLIRHGALFGPTRIEAQCSGKEAFANGAMAHRTAVRMLAKKNRKKNKGSVDVYRCPHCGKYHIGRS